MRLKLSYGTISLQDQRPRDSKSTGRYQPDPFDGMSRNLDKTFRALKHLGCFRWKSVCVVICNYIWISVCYIMLLRISSAAPVTRLCIVQINSLIEWWISNPLQNMNANNIAPDRHLFLPMSPQASTNMNKSSLVSMYIYIYIPSPL